MTQPAPKSLEIAVTGASGFVGSALLSHLLERKHRVRALSRTARGAGGGVRWIAYDPMDPASLAKAIDGVDVVIHLAGDGVFDGRWTAAKMERIRSSRVEATRALVAAIGGLQKRPSALISGSAVGYYGPRPWEEELGESSAPGNDFLAQVCRGWEDEARMAEGHGVRVALARIGIVIGRGGGALAKMVPPFRMFVGGPIGFGRQAFPWVHLADVVGLLTAMAEDDGYRGPVNVVAPTCVTNKQFSKALGRALHRPALLPTPGLALRVGLGKVAGILTTGQRVVPGVASRRGYTWRFPTVDAAVAEAVSEPAAAGEPPPAGPRPGRRVYVLEKEQFVPLPLATAWLFFSDARNLARITPPWMGFVVRSEGPLEMAAGTTIDYRIRVLKLPMRWRSLISVWEPGHRFADVMLRGPYRSWHHVHTFHERDGGTLIRDRIEYSLPMGPLGRLAHALFVRRQLEGIFAYRREAIHRILSGEALCLPATHPAAPRTATS